MAQKPSRDWPLRINALTGLETLLKQNTVTDPAPQEERISTNLIKEFVKTRFRSEFGITDLSNISTPSTLNTILKWNGSNFVWVAETDTNLFSENKTLSENRTHDLDSYALKFKSDNGGSFGVGDYDISDDGSGFEFNQNDAEIKLANLNLKFYDNLNFGSEYGSLFIDSNNLNIKTESGDIILDTPTGDNIVLSGFGSGNKTATNLSKTESSSVFVPATDGTILEKPISELGIVGGSGSTIYQYSATTGCYVWATTTGVTASLSSGTLTITVPNGGFLLKGEVEYSSAQATYSTGVSGAYRIRIVHQDGSTIYSTTPSVMGRTSIGTINSGNPLSISSATLNDYRIDERGGGAISYVLRQLSTRTPNGGFIYF